MHRVRAFVVRASLEIKLPVEIFPSRDGAIVNVKKKNNNNARKTTRGKFSRRKGKREVKKNRNGG